MKHILLIDKSLPFTQSFALFLRQHFDYKVSVASDGNEGVCQHCRCPADLVITQFPVPEKKSRDFILELKEANPEVKIITLSLLRSSKQQDNLLLARQLGVRQAFLKPFAVEEVLEAIEEELGVLIPN